jgi:hypothetical protein
MSALCAVGHYEYAEQTPGYATVKNKMPLQSRFKSFRTEYLEVGHPKVRCDWARSARRTSRSVPSSASRLLDKGVYPIQLQTTGINSDPVEVPDDVPDRSGRSSDRGHPIPWRGNPKDRCLFIDPKLNNVIRTMVCQ